MTNLPDVVRPEPTREIERADVDSWIGVASDVVKLANLIAPTEFVPRSLRDSAPATAAAILYGREVGLPPMTALTQTHVIEGKPAMSAEAMRALVLAAGHDLEVVETNRARCEIRGRRHGQERWQTIAVSIDEFAHLRTKDNWRNYPRQMLQARATAELCRLAFPDVIHGFRATEEFDDLEETREALAPAPNSSTVRRAAKKTAAKKTTPPPLEQRSERPELTGPPLPGEEGFQDSAEEAGPGVMGSPSSPGLGAEDRAAGGAADSSSAEQTPDADHEPASEAEETPAGQGEGEAQQPAGDSEDRGAEAGPPDVNAASGGGTSGGTRGPRKATRSQLRMIFALLKELNDGEDMPDQDRHDIARAICHRPVESYSDLTADNAATLLDTLGRVKTREDLDALLAAAAKAEADRWNEGDRS